MILTWNKIIIVPFIIALYFFSGCNNPEKNIFPDDIFNGKKSKVKYARYFDLYDAGKIKKIVIYSPFDDSSSKTYYLVDSSEYNLYSGYKNVLKVPLTNVGILSATQLNGLIRMNLLNRVKGISDIKYITDSTVREKINSDEISEIASGNNFYTEKVLMLNLEAIFYSPFKKNQEFNTGSNSEIIPFYDFMENSPLGRAEWVKFSGAFFNTGNIADSIFYTIDDKYNKLKTLADESGNKPSVFSGKYFNGQWFVPGGKSYMAQMFSDAGADYIFKDNKSVSGIALDFEVIYKKAEKADYWRILGGVNSSGDFYSNLESDNELYSYFDAFKKHHILYCDPYKTSYFERGTLEPQVLLSDLIFAFHKELMPDYTPVYYYVVP